MSASEESLHPASAISHFTQTPTIVILSAGEESRYPCPQLTHEFQHITFETPAQDDR